MVDMVASVSRVLEAYQAAVAAKDVHALMQLYDPGVRVFDTWGVWSYEGAAEWQRAVESWLGSTGTERLMVSFEGTQVVAQGEMALTSSIVTYAAMTAQGEPLRSMQNRLTWGMKREGEVLLIVHEHTSAPAGFEDMTLILQRDQ